MRARLSRDMAGLLVSVLLGLTALGLTALGLTACGMGEITDTITPSSSEKESGELCDNGVDDDDDGLVDCADSDCALHPACVKSAPGNRPGDPPFESCGLSSGDRHDHPVDMIWILDSSPSMGTVVNGQLGGELGWIQSQLNHFANRLIARRADIHLVLLGAPQICIEQPLAGPGCADGARFRHIKEYIGSHDALPMAVSLFPRYADFLRPKAKRFVVVVSDDDAIPVDSKKVVPGWEAGVTGPNFDKKFRAASQGLIDSYVFSSIVGWAPTGQHPRGCRTAQAKGHTYIALAETTQGRVFSICNPNWEEVFDLLGRDVAGSVNVPCVYPTQIMDGTGTLTDARRLQVEAEVDGRWQVLSSVPDLAACGETQPGWYTSGTQLELCPAVCGALSVSRVRVYHACPPGILE